MKCAILRLSAAVYNDGCGCGCCVSCFCDSGVINAAAGAKPLMPGGQGACPLAHCHTAVGHRKAVLSLAATDSHLYTASKGPHFFSA